MAGRRESEVGRLIPTASLPDHSKLTVFLYLRPQVLTGSPSFATQPGVS